MLILNESDIFAVNDHSGMRLQMREALRRLSIGSATSFPRHVVSLTEERALGFMPASSGDLLGYKAVSVHPTNGSRGLNPHQGVVVLLDSTSGRPKAILEGSTVTAIRTAAVSAAATESLSRTDCQILGLIGAGRQALEHVLALSPVRSFKEILIYSRTSASTRRLIQELECRIPLKIKEYRSPEEVVCQADVLVVCTSSGTPLFDSDKLPLGVHVNAVGACRPGAREVRLKTHPCLNVYMDSKSACLSEASEIIESLAAGELDSTNLVGEIGDHFAQRLPGRTGPDDITFFKSVGLGIMDLFAADFLVRRALDLKVGHHVNFGDNL